jgi:3-hydroxyisobutyrate dehydrogenase-like beta-hydroxyacid dehydrogenase
MKEKIGILHPGEMGVSIAASARAGGHEVYWVSDGRSQETASRAEAQGLIDRGSLGAFCRHCTIVLSVCPPAAAEAVAMSVMAHGFTGLFVDANAISPDRAKRIGAALEAAGIGFVDGGIIGGPAWKPGRTWLYLSGSESERAAGLFVGGPLETEIIGPEPGTASALKMCFAAYTKGTSALLAAVLGAAEGHGVRALLEAQWSQGGSDFAEQTRGRVRRVTKKAWRFAGELEEIAATFESAGLPGGFHLAGAEVYRRMAGFKGWEDEPPPLEEVLRALAG